MPLQRRKVSQPESTHLRLPNDMVRTIRRRARVRGITMVEALRQMMGRGGRVKVDLPQQVAELHNRLAAKQAELEETFEDSGADAAKIDRAISALGKLYDAWPEEEDEEDEEEEEEPLALVGAEEEEEPEEEDDEGE